ncbi:MAG: 50S ribosomal protein L11 methyltransferase [Bacillota bacterium]
MKWKEVKVKIPISFKENAIDILSSFNSGGVVISDIASPLDDFSDEIWKEITAYYKANEEFTDILKKIKDYFDLSLKNKKGKYILTVNEIEDENWSTSWHKYFSPTKVGNNFIICPSWNKITNKKRKIIEINPGQAFGVGTHESTDLAILLLEKHLKNYEKDINILDVGTGTSILSIAAAKLNFNHILAIDISEDAVRTSRENIKINNVKNKIALQKRNIRNGVNGEYEVVFANLLADIIDKVLGEIVKYTKDGALIILSGIIEKEFSKIINLAKSLSLELIDSEQKGEWVSCVLKKG